MCDGVGGAIFQDSGITSWGGAQGIIGIVPEAQEGDARVGELGPPEFHADKGRSHPKTGGMGVLEETHRVRTEHHQESPIPGGAWKRVTRGR